MRPRLASIRRLVRVRSKLSDAARAHAEEAHRAREAARVASCSAENRLQEILNEGHCERGQRVSARSLEDTDLHRAWQVNTVSAEKQKLQASTKEAKNRDHIAQVKMTEHRSLKKVFQKMKKIQEDKIDREEQRHSDDISAAKYRRRR